MTAPTQSGIPTAICPLPPGALVSAQDLAQALGIDAREFHQLTNDPQAPALPHAFVCGGTRQFDSALAQRWLKEAQAFREGLPALEAFRAQERARAQHEARMRKLHAEDQQSAWVGERARMIEDAARQNALEAEGKDSGRGGNAILPFSSGSV